MKSVFKDIIFHKLGPNSRLPHYPRYKYDKYHLISQSSTMKPANKIVTGKQGQDVWTDMSATHPLSNQLVLAKFNEHTKNNIQINGKRTLETFGTVKNDNELYFHT